MMLLAYIGPLNTAANGYSASGMVLQPVGPMSTPYALSAYC